MKYYCNNTYINNLSEIIIFIISPLLSLPIIILGIYKGKYSNLVLLSLFMALVAFYTPPFADLYRHTLRYLNYVQNNNPNYIVINPSGNDFILYSLSNYFAKMNIPFEFIRAIFVFVCYQISFFFFRKVKDENKYSKEAIFYVFLIFFFSVPFIWIVNGLRMATACYIAALGWYYSYNKKKILSYLFFLISLGVHFASLMFLPLLIINKLSIPKFSKQSFIYIAVFVFLMGTLFIKIIPSSLIAFFDLERQMDGYLISTKYSDIMSINGRIALFLERASLIYILYLFLKERIINNTEDKIFIQISYIFLFALYPFVVPFQKFSLFLIPILLFIVLKNSLDFIHIRLLLFTTCIMCLSYIYGYRVVFINTPFYELIKTPFYDFIETNTIVNFKDSIIPK